MIVPVDDPGRPRDERSQLFVKLGFGHARPVRSPVQVIQAVNRDSQRLAKPLPSEILRIVPAASERLPSVALGIGGGGEVPVDPSDPQGDRAVLSLFEVELALPPEAAVQHWGGRVYVRFDHGSEPLAAQWGRRLRQLFLARFHV